MGIRVGGGRKGGRGVKKFHFTLRQVAEIVELTPTQVRRLARSRTRKERDGSRTVVPAAFDPTSLLSVLAFILERSPDHQRRLAEVVLATASGGVTAGAAALGISRSSLYRRAKKVPTP